MGVLIMAYYNIGYWVEDQDIEIGELIFIGLVPFSNLLTKIINMIIIKLTIAIV